MISGRGLGHTGGTLDKLESIPGFRTDLTVDAIPRATCRPSASASSARRRKSRPPISKLYALRDVTATVESIPLIASSIMSKKMAEGVDALVLDVKVGNGAFMKKQVDARRLAQAMVGIGRRLDKRVQALITDMNQPLGYAVGNALEVMEASQTLQKAGPADLTRAQPRTGRAHDLTSARKPRRSTKRRKLAEDKLVDGSAYKKFKQVVAGAGRQCAGARPVRTAAQCHGHARSHFAARRLRQRHRWPKTSAAPRTMIGAGRDRKEDPIDPAVGVILEVKVGEKVEAGSRALPPLLHQGRALEEAAEMVEDAFRISGTTPEERELILEVVG